MTLLRAGLRHLARHPWQAALSIVGIAVGVGVVVAIDLANESARSAFRLSAEAVSGRATHAVVGGPEGLDERLYVRLRLAGDLPPTAPVIEGAVTVPGPAGRTLQLLGVDPLAEAPFRAYWNGRDGAGATSPSPGAGPPGSSAALPGPAALAALLTEPGAVVLARETAKELGLRPGQSFAVRVGGVARSARLVGLVDPADGPSRRALEGLLLADVSTAQELTGRPGRLDRIDVAVPGGAAGERALARLQALLPAEAEVVPASSRSEFVGQVTRAFSLNLTALSLLALVVGFFLVYSTVSFSVVQRRPTLGMLRVLGVTRRELFRLMLLEGLLLGVVATALGLALGLVLARGLVGLVARTINDLYFAVAVRELAVPAYVLLKGGLCGLGTTLLGVAGPAREAAASPPGVVVSRAALEGEARRRAPWAALTGAAAIAAGALVLWLSGRSLAWSYAGLFACVLGSALLTPGAIVTLARLARPAASRAFGVIGGLAVRGVEASLSRTAVALAALVVAVAASVGVTVMIASFRQTVVDWLETSLAADVYVSAAGAVRSRADTPLHPAVVGRLAVTPGIAAMGTYRRVAVRSDHGPTALVALDLPEGSRRQFRFLAGSPASIWPVFQDGRGVIVSEPYAYRHDVGVGALLLLHTDRGPRPFRVAGVFADYGSDQGVVIVGRRAYEESWDDRRVSSLGITAAPGTDVDLLVRELRARVGPEQEVLVRSNRALRAASLEIFDRTFAITGVLRLVAMGVAFVGVLSALMALQLERGREVAVLRAQGLTPAGVWGLCLGQSGLMGLVAGLLALPVGLALAEILVVVINRRSFGWTLQLAVAPGALGEAVALAVGAALLAGVYPAHRLAQAVPATALREE